MAFAVVLCDPPLPPSGSTTLRVTVAERGVDEDDLAVLVLPLQREGGIEDLVIVLAILEHFGGIDPVEVVLGHHLQLAVGGAVERDPVREDVALRYAVEVADELARLVVDRIIPLLEGIEFFEHLYRYGYIVLFEVGDG